MNTMNNYQMKQIDFKFGDYISQGFELFKKDIGGFVVATFFTMVMSMIPFCSFVAIGNFYKYCRKKNNGQKASASEIFNFDDFGVYVILNLILFGFGLAFMIPYLLMMGMLTTIESGSGAGIMGVLMMFFIFAVVIVILYISLKAFYMTALISLEGERDWKQAWKNSKIMTQGNLLIIFLFSLVVGFIGEIGIILCVIGIFLTLPITYICYYIASEDALNQIKKDEIGTVSH